MRTWINELIHVGGRSLLFARLDRTDDKCGARVSSNGKSGLPNKTSRGINKITDRFAPRYDSREQKYLQVHRTNRSRAIRGTMGNWFGCVRPCSKRYDDTGSTHRYFHHTRHHTRTTSIRRTTDLRAHSIVCRSTIKKRDDSSHED